MFNTAELQIKAACNGDSMYRDSLTVTVGEAIGTIEKKVSSYVRKVVSCEGEDGIDVYCGDDENGNEIWERA